MLLAGDFFLGAVVAAALTKLVLRLRETSPTGSNLNKRTAQVPHLALIVPHCQASSIMYSSAATDAALLSLSS